MGYYYLFFFFSKSPDVNFRQIGFPCIYTHIETVCLMLVTQLTKLLVRTSSRGMNEGTRRKVKVK